MPEEQFDIYDENNQPLGITKPRSQVHAEGDWHRVIHVWVINSNNELLIQKRAAIKESRPNLWDISSAGHISAGESAEISATRELKEEIGIPIDPSELTYLFTLKSSSTQHDGKYIDNEYNLVYLLRIDLDINKLVLQKEEVSEVAWMALEKLAELAIHDDPTFVKHTEEYKRLYEFITV